MEQLKGEPLLLNGGQKRPRADSIVEVAVEVLTHEVGSFVGVHPPLERPYVRQRNVGKLLPDLCQAALVDLSKEYKISHFSI